MLNWLISVPFKSAMNPVVMGVGNLKVTFSVFRYLRLMTLNKKLNKKTTKLHTINMPVRGLSACTPCVGVPPMESVATIGDARLQQKTLLLLGKCSF